MNVEELITELQCHDGDLTVKIEDDAGTYLCDIRRVYATEDRFDGKVVVIG